MTQGIKEKTWARTLPGRPRERGQTLLGMIAHHPHPLMLRMKSTWRMKLVLVWESLTNHKGKSANWIDDNNTGQLHMGDPDPDHGSQGIDAPDQVDLTEILHDIQAPANAGDSKEDKLFFLGALLKEATYQAMVQWLEDNLVAIFPLLYGDYQ